MGRFQNVLLILLLSVCGPSAFANGWGAVAGTGGFQGALSAGALYQWQNTHVLELMLGEYTIDNGHGFQLNLDYNFVPWNIPWEKATLQPLRVGLMVLYSLDFDDYFTSSPSKYPTPGYYERTGARLALSFGVGLGDFGNRLHLILEAVCLDTGITAVVNNRLSDLKNFLSAGFKVSYDL